MSNGAIRSERPGAMASRKILFVEDMLELREAATGSLRSHGYTVVEAADGGQAVRQASKESFDVVVMDLAMPFIDGIEAIKRIRANGKGKRPHVIVLSGQPDARTRQLAFAAGCDPYILKPIELDALHAAVRVYFTKRDGHD
jgi:CheY-like chemotaxis protein